MATSWDTEPRRAEGTALRPWDPTTTVSAILDASISVVAAKPVTLWAAIGCCAAIVRTRAMAAVRTGSCFAGVSLVPSCCLSVITTSVSRACTTCSGRSVRWASATAQRRAESLDGEPSTPTTTLPSVIQWLLKLGSSGRRPLLRRSPQHGRPQALSHQVTGACPQKFAPEFQKSLIHGLRSANGDPDGRDQWCARCACGVGRLGGPARACGVSAQATAVGSAADHRPDRARDAVQEARPRRSVQRLHLLVGL